MTKFYIAILLLTFAIAAAVISYQVQVADFNIEAPISPTWGDLVANDNQVINSVKKAEVIEALPQPDLEIRNSDLEINLDVPFTSQAPYANWDKLHNQACEEAAVVMVHYFLKGLELTPAKADEEIIKLVNWQVTNWGNQHHLSVKDVARLLRYYGWKNVEVSFNITVDDIKNQLIQGRPVIVPTAGRELGNPYYKRPGPLYHMLVIKGFKENMFITNDPGTKRGENFLYRQDILFRAIHDLPPHIKLNNEDLPLEGGELILTGRKAMIVVDRK